MEVGPALLIEYTAPAAVVIWLWLRHGQRPGPILTLIDNVFAGPYASSEQQASREKILVCDPDSGPACIERIMF